MDASSDLTKLKVADLKKELKIRGLNTAGKRSELLERLQAAIAAGVGLAEDDGEEEYDEDEILAGDDADDDDSKMTPSEEAAALAAAAKTTATPARGRRVSTQGAAGTPRTGQKKLALRRNTTLVVPEEPATPVAAAAVAASPVKKAATPVAPAKQPTPKKTIATEQTGEEPAKKVLKLGADAVIDAPESNGDAEAPAAAKTPLEIRQERFGITNDTLKKQKRSERFGSSKLSKETVEVDVDTLKARAARFGEVTAKTLTKTETDEKKKARSARFGNGTDEAKTDVDSEEVKQKRAARFTADSDTTKVASTEPGEPLVSASGKTVITIGTEDAIKIKRAARFGA